MATYGLRVINDDSELLIDSNFTNPAFVQKIEFSGTPTSESVESSRGFQRRIHTASISTPGNYIVMWTLPENPGYNDGTTGSSGYYKFLYYHFPTSATTTMNSTISCHVFVYGSGDAYTYKLPTAYLFAITDLPNSGSYGLQLFNDSGQKTYDSNNIQLVPTNFSDTFTFWNQTGVSNLINLPDQAGASMDLSTSGSNPIFFLPNYYQYKVYPVPPNYTSWSGNIYVPVYYRSGNVVGVTEFVDSIVSGTGEFPGGNENRGTLYGQPWGWEYTSGNKSSMSIVAADSSLYAAPSPGQATGTSPNYTLSIYTDPYPAQEGSNITVQINTTNVPNGTTYPWTVTGISAADLSSGSLTGTFTINSNLASAYFTVANDNLTEGTETFTFTVNNTGSTVSTNIIDTSQTPGYSWATPTSINEGSTGSLQFNFSGAINKTVAFSLVYGTNVDSTDVTLSTTSYSITSNAAGTVAVNYSIAADLKTEGTEYFQLRATVNGVNYDSANITINDTSTTPPPVYGITAVNPPWNENTTQSTTVTLNNVNGYVYYPTSDNANVTCQTSTFTVTSNTYTATLYWNVGNVSADTTVNLYLRRSSAVGTIDAQTSVTVKNILPAGTPIGSAYCVAYGTSPYTLRQVYADGSGGTYNTDTNNSTTCGYVAPTYSLSASPTTVNEGASFVITLTTNQSGSFPYTITGVTTADIGGTSLTGSLANGGTRTISVTADSFTEGTEYFVVTLDNGLANVTVTINDTSKNATSIQRSTYTGPLNSTQNTSNSVSFFHVGIYTIPSMWTYSGSIPPGMSFSVSDSPYSGYYNVYTLAGTATTAGNYTFTIYATADNGDSAQASFTYTVNAPTYPAAGTTSGGQYCSGTTLYQNYNDGSGGTYASVVAYNSASCGYVAPSYSLGNTWTDLANGSSGTFYVQSNAANGVTLTPSLSGAGASRVSVSPTSSTISGNGTVYTYFTVTATTPTSTVTAQSVTVSVAGKSFTFTVQAFTVSTIPLVSTIQYAYGEAVYAGDSLTAIINFNGPITAGTYVRVQINAGVYGTGNNVFQAGASYSNAGFPIGASSGYYISNANPGLYNTTGRVSARTEDVNGTLQQNYVVGPFFTLWDSNTPPA